MILKIGQDGGSTGEWRGEITTNPSKVAKYLINFSSSVRDILETRRPRRHSCGGSKHFYEYFCHDKEQVTSRVTKLSRSL